MTDELTLEKTLAIKLYQMDKLQDYLEEMALKGWELTEISDKYIFGKIEPKKIIYSVEYYDTKGLSDKEVSLFYKTAEEKGWKFMGNDGKLCVFKSQTEYPSPINFNREDQYEAVRKSYFLSSIKLWIISPAVPLVNLYKKGFKDIFSNFDSIAVFIVSLYPVIVAVADILSFTVWCARSRNSYINGSRSRRELGLGILPALKNISYIVMVAVLLISMIH